MYTNKYYKWDTTIENVDVNLLYFISLPQMKQKMLHLQCISSLTWCHGEMENTIATYNVKFFFQSAQSSILGIHKATFCE